MSDFNLTKFLEQYAKPNAFGQVGWKQPTREAAKQDMEEWRRQQLEAADPPLQDHLAATAADISVLTPHGAILQMLAPIAAKRNVEGLKESFDIAKMLMDPLGGGATPLHGDGLAATAWARKGVPKEVALSRAASGAAQEAETASQLLHRLINDRNTVYHATGVNEAKSILDAGAILPNPWLHQGLGKAKQKQLMKEAALAKIQAGEQPSAPVKPVSNPSASEFTKVENPSWMYDVHEEKSAWTGEPIYYANMGPHTVQGVDKEDALTQAKKYTDTYVKTFAHPNGTQLTIHYPDEYSPSIFGYVKMPNDSGSMYSVSLPNHFPQDKQIQFLVDAVNDAKKHKVNWVFAGYDYNKDHIAASKNYVLTTFDSSMIHPQAIKETANGRYYIDEYASDLIKNGLATAKTYYSSLEEAQAAFKKQNKNWATPDAWYGPAKSENPTAGVSVSRIARIKPKESRAVSFVIDNEKMPPARPLAEVGFRKVVEDDGYSQFDKAKNAWLKDLHNTVNDALNKFLEKNPGVPPEVYAENMRKHTGFHNAWQAWIQDITNSHQDVRNKLATTFNMNEEEKMQMLAEQERLTQEYNTAVAHYGHLEIPTSYLDAHNVPHVDPTLLDWLRARNVYTKAHGSNNFNDIPKKYLNTIVPMNKHFEYEDRTYNEEIPTSAIKQILIDKNALPKYLEDDPTTKLSRYASIDDIVEEARKMYGNKLPIKIFENSKQMHAERAYKTKDLKELFMKLLQGR